MTTTKRYPKETLERALHDAKQIGIIRAARRHKIAQSTLRYHAIERSIPFPRERSTTNRHLDEELAILVALFPGQPFTQKEIAQILSGVTRQGIYEIEKRALRKVRLAMIQEGVWRELRNI